MPRSEYSWLGFASCGHAVFVSIEEDGGPDEDLFKNLARLRKDGRRVERMLFSEAKKHIGEMASCKCEKTPAEQKLAKKYAAQHARERKRFGR